MLIASAALLAAPTPAYAGWQQGEAQGDAEGDGTLMAGATQTQIEVTQSGGSGSTGLTPTHATWTPPVCWYEPVATPEQLKSAVKKMNPQTDTIPVSPSVGWGEEWMKERYGRKSQYSKYDDYATEHQGEGKWYRGVVNPNRRDEAPWDACSRDMIFALDREKPPAQEMVTPEVLAGYAYDEVRIPDTDVEMSPDGRQVVNLPTWVWSDGPRFKPGKVTARLPGTGLWATTTAKPVSLHLDPGTENAKVYPTGGDCPIRDDGSIGTPYNASRAKQDPPCGLTYLRATGHDGPYEFKATVRWEISWNGSGGAGGKLPDGTFGTATNLTVREVQAVNR
ncbi:hypothetical protein ACTWP8_35510 [Streptomyces sp. 7N604]